MTYYFETYGCEMNMVSPYLNIVYNPNDSLLYDNEYVVFEYILSNYIFFVK